MIAPVIHPQTNSETSLRILLARAAIHSTAATPTTLAIAAEILETSHQASDLALALQIREDLASMRDPSRPTKAQRLAVDFARETQAARMAQNFEITEYQPINTGHSYPPFLTEFDHSITRAQIRPKAAKSRRGFIRANLLVGFFLLAGLALAHIAAAGPIARLEADRAHAAAIYCGRC